MKILVLVPFVYLSWLFLSDARVYLRRQETIDGLMSIVMAGMFLTAGFVSALFV